MGSQGLQESMGPQVLQVDQAVLDPQDLLGLKARPDLREIQVKVELPEILER